MRGLASITGALALALPMTASHGQMPADFEVFELKKGDGEVMRDARPFADCLVAHKAKEIPKYLGSLVYAMEWIARDMAKAHPECPAPSKLGKHTTVFLQAALLEALIKRDFGSTPPPVNFNHLGPFLYVKTTDNDLSKESFANLIEPYDCVSRREPAKVQAFLATLPMSNAEAAAFANLKTTIVACQPKGETWELRAYFARRYLAETYYTLMKVDQRRKAGVQ
jgi:hypothetical protein